MLDEIKPVSIITLKVNRLKTIKRLEFLRVHFKKIKLPSTLNILLIVFHRNVQRMTQCAENDRDTGRKRGRQRD